ncbi:MAG: endonuclease/exonuclease/phosphatase family protein [Clostridia bacterium]|nr:endonuclease/exonuclease/phosphatase family protein [Clostridia bacterium]
MKIKVFTFNLRVNASVDGINAFPNRKGRILDTIRTYSPDLIGFQEANDDMREWLRAELSDYVVVGCGRNEDYRGESVVLAYKKDAFEALWTECFWLSATPYVPGSTYGLDQSSCPRVTTVACLKHRDAAEPIVFCNTHLDHKGKTARLLGAVQLMQYLSEKPYRFVLTGDFNALPDTPEIQAITSLPGLDVTDATHKLGGTFHAFGKREVKTKIDYIFTNLPCDVSDSFIVPDEGIDGIYISDHHPVCATVTI